MYEYYSRLHVEDDEKRIIDGDTVEMIVDLGFNIRVQAMIRLIGVDTHELYGDKREQALKEKQFVEKWFHKWYSEDTEFPYVLRTRKEPGSFGRYLGTIWDYHKESELNFQILDNFDDVKWEE